MAFQNPTILYTPGPVNVPPRVLEAGSRPMMHHRTPEFSALLDNMITKMKTLFGTNVDVLPVHTTGRGAMEGVLRNLFSTGDKILCICNGKFGHMFADIGSVCNLRVRRVHENWTEQVMLSQIEKLLIDDKDIKAVTVVYSDTSNGVLNPVSEIGRIVRKHNRLLIVDCISSIGAMAFDFDGWNVDVAITASQKGLMAPAGLSFVAINDRGWKAAQDLTPRSYYVNFHNIKRFFNEKKETPGSTPVSLVCAVNESLNMLFEEQLNNVYKRHEIISKAIKKSVEAIGLSLFPEGDIKRSHSVTVLRLPTSIKSSQVKSIAKNKYNVLLASGLGDYKASTIRIGHIGMIEVREAILIVSILELALYELGFVNTLGKAVANFYAAYSEAY